MGKQLDQRNSMKAQSLQELATVFNTKGGIVFVLLIMWLFTLCGTVSFGIWIIAKGIDPQHTIVVTILGMLVSQAFGNVNGALFTAFKGEDPHPLSGTSTTYTKTLSHDLPSDELKTVHPIQPLPPKNPSSQASPTRSSPDFNMPSQAPDAIETQINIQTPKQENKSDFPGWKAPDSNNTVNSPPTFKAVIRPKADK
jgi:hypothetical protein